MKNSFVELHARERAEALLDDNARELVGPLDNITTTTKQQLKLKK